MSTSSTPDVTVIRANLLTLQTQLIQDLEKFQMLSSYLASDPIINLVRQKLGEYQGIHDSIVTAYQKTFTP